METCRWCTESAKGPVSVDTFLYNYCTGVLTPKEMNEADGDFIYCSECVVEYHQARERVSERHKVQTHRNQMGVLTHLAVLSTPECGGSYTAHSTCTELARGTHTAYIIHLIVQKVLT